MKRKSKSGDARPEGWVALTIAAAVVATVVLSQENPVAADEVTASIAAIDTETNLGEVFDLTPMRPMQAASAPIIRR